MEGCIKVCQCLLHGFHGGSLFAGRYTPIELVTNERKRLYSPTRLISPRGGKMLRVKCNKKKVTLHKK